MASWLDTISEKGKELFSNYSTQFVESYLKKETPPNVVVAPPAKSNLTADQVADGQRGAIAGLQQFSSSMNGYLMPVLVLGAFIVAAFAFKKR